MKPAAPEQAAMVLCHPAILPLIGDDHTPADWRPAPGPIYLMPDNAGACISFVPRTLTLWEVHAAVLPEFRRQSVEYGQAAAKWMRDNTPCRCIEAHAYNFPSKRLLERLGFKRIGTLPRSKLRGGVLVDQVIYALEV